VVEALSPASRADAVTAMTEYEVDVLVTDDSAPAEVLADLIESGVHVVTA